MGHRPAPSIVTVFGFTEWHLMLARRSGADLRKGTCDEKVQAGWAATQFTLTAIPLAWEAGTGGGQVKMS